MTIESDKAAEIQKNYSMEMAIVRTRHSRILTVYFSTGFYRVKDSKGEILFSHENPSEIERFLSLVVNFGV